MKQYTAHPPVAATALIVDLRNFTPNLKAAAHDEQGISHFCHFLSHFYAVCLEASLAALPEPQRECPPLAMSSTGDGVLVIFHDSDWHFGHGFLAAILLHHLLGGICDGYNRGLAHPNIPGTSFGIGLDSGEVCRVQAQSPTKNGHPLLDTYVGDCINVAARAQEVSKMLFKGHTVVAEGTYERLARAIADVSYRALVKTINSRLSDQKRQDVDGRLTDLANRLCLTFIHLHQLKGVDRPTSLFRLAESRARPGYAPFDGLLRQLVRQEAAHLQEVTALLSR